MRFKLLRSGENQQKGAALRSAALSVELAVNQL